MKTSRIIVASAVAAAVGAVAVSRAKTKRHAAALKATLGPPVPLLTQDGVAFRDLNGNGRLDVYEDPRAPIGDRVDDLLDQMRLEEKVGLMFQPMIAIGKNGSLVEQPDPMSPAPTPDLVIGRHLRHFNITMAPGVRDVARWHNELQHLAERTRLGIPVTVASDPRHAAEFNIGAGIKQKGFSLWPSQLGLAAIGEEETVEEFGDIARREYMAVGLRTVLNPMADVATEPRWGRIGGTFGEDPELAAGLTAAYVRGFQAGPGGVGPESVSCMVKHFPGCGPVQDGLEPHFSFGSDQVYPGDNLDAHVRPFRAAVDAGVRQVMPSYGIPIGQTAEDVAMAFNREIITDLLRDDVGFDGIVCTDWVVIQTERMLGRIAIKEASAWGVEDLTVPERFAKAIDAGVDQFGGQSEPSGLFAAIDAGLVTEGRIDESVRRILRLKFELGLFDNPFVDEDAAEELTGTDEFVAAGVEAQRRSMVLLTNEADGAPYLPLARDVRLYVDGVDKDVAGRYGEVVGSPADADVAIIRKAAPKRLRIRKHFLELFFPQGPLTFTPRQLSRLIDVCRTVPTVVDIRLDRPAVIPELADEAAAVFASFGSTDEVLLDAVFGEYQPTGRLPVDMPSSMAAVERSRTDIPFDTEDPLFRFGHGLTYE